MKHIFKQFKANNAGVGVVEVILILVVLIALVLIFKTQLTALVTRIFGSINSGTGAIIG